ncbi:MAG TPA: cyclic nucleotide-binding domain-containing protein [Chloroflexota bacterium]|nr:cyclic nucleotide-binding domain-containing protein [Chloroflexota bacterium]
MQTLEPILAGHPFFAGLSEHYLRLLVGCAANARFNADQFLLREGQEADRFYLIRSGKVRLEIFTPERGLIVIQTLGEGDVLGWSWLMPPYRWSLDAQAVELTRAIVLDGLCLRGKCEADHDLGYELHKRFASIVVQRLQATRLQLLDVYGIHR